MPTKTKSRRSSPQRSAASPLADAQAEVLARFDRLIKDKLSGLIGKSLMSRLRSDLAIVSNTNRGVVVHAGLKHRGIMTVERIRKEKPIVGVLANSFTLIDPVTLRELKPGAYVVRLRAIGSRMAFDFFDEKGFPSFSTIADPTDGTSANQDPKNPVNGLADADFDWPWEDDSLSPPPDWGTSGRLCLSFLIWKHCWTWDWPDIHWPW